MFRKQTAALTMIALLACANAQADMPQYQFGYKGWPNRQEIPCDPGTTPSHTAPPQWGESTQTPPADATNMPVAPTLPAVTATPEATATTTPVVPTAQPIATPSVTSALPTQNPSMDDDYTTDSISMQEQKALNLLNQDRIANGLPALTMDPALSRIARIKAQDMRDNNYFAHTSPTYGSVSEMLRHFNYSFNVAGENIAHHATVEKSQAAFMSSAGHRKNILSSWTKCGIGVAVDRNGFVYVTQLFAR